jgi:hypothetical protein
MGPVGWWLRDNADRIALAAIGLGAVLIGVAFHEQQFLGTCVILVGIAVLVFSVLIRRIDALDVSTTREERLHQVETELDAIEERLDGAVEATTEAPDAPPTVIPEAPSVR